MKCPSVQNMAERCLPCQANGLDSRPEPLSLNELPPSPWHTVHLDFCGPFPSGEYALVVIAEYCTESLEFFKLGAKGISKNYCIFLDSQAFFGSAGD